MMKRRLREGVEFFQFLRGSGIRRRKGGWMITELRLQNFKNFKDASLRLGPFTVLVGANASGKSNIRDAFRFLHGVGRRYSLAEIIGGKYGSWRPVRGGNPLRGGANEIVRLGEHDFAIDVTLASESSETHGKEGVSVSRYPCWGRKKVGLINGGGFRMSAEALGRWRRRRLFGACPGRRQIVACWRRSGVVSGSIGIHGFDNARAQFSGCTGGPTCTPLSFVCWQHQDLKAHPCECRWVREELGGIRFLDLVPDQMRLPAFPGQNVLGDSGENLAAVLWELCQTSERKAILIRLDSGTHAHGYVYGL